MLGSNYIPATAINELEMWQADTFDPKRIDTELGWAESIGFNTMRVFLHDLLWQQDPKGFQKRIDTFLDICRKASHQAALRPVRFRLGSQPEARQATRSDARRAQFRLAAKSRRKGAARIRRSIRAWKPTSRASSARFANDERILGWDIWNEPDNTNAGSYKDPANKAELVTALLPQAFAWAREAHASQPLTSGVWKGDDWSSRKT